MRVKTAFVHNIFVLNKFYIHLQLDDALNGVSKKISQLDEDVEVVMVLTRDQLQIPLQSMVESLSPQFDDARLLRRSHLKQLQMKAQVSFKIS